MQTRQTRAAILLASGQSKQDSARAVGVDPSTLRRWLKAPEFNAILRLETQRAEAGLRATISRAETITFRHAVTGAQNQRFEKHAFKKRRTNEDNCGHPARTTAHLPRIAVQQFPSRHNVTQWGIGR